MKQWFLIIGIMVGIALSGAVLASLVWGRTSQDSPVESPHLPSLTPMATEPFSPTATRTSTPHPISSTTVTLSTRVAIVTLLMPDVTLVPTITPLPNNLQILSAAPDPIEPLPNATLLPFSYREFTKWVSFESDHPAMRYIKGNWQPIGSRQASQGQYHYTEDTAALVQFSFRGQAVRVRYVGFSNGGIWQVVIDGQVVDQIDSYAPLGMFTGTRVYALGPGEHTLALHNTEQAHPASSGHMLAFDAVQVYQPDDLTWIIPGGVLPSLTPTATLIPAGVIELIAAPPSPPATATDVPIQMVSTSVVLGYDENANGELDVSEGIRGMSVRLVESETNRVLAQAFTDEQGFAQLQVATHASVLLVVPYFSQSWVVSGRSEQQFTLLLAAGNQPGLIP